MFGFSAFFFSYSTMVSLAVIGGLSTVTGGTVLTTMMVGVIAAQPFAPWFGQVLGLKGAILTAIGLQMIGQVLGLVISPALLALVLAGLFGGVGFGFFVVLANAAVPATVPPGRIGKALGIFGGVTSFAAALGAPFGLWLVETVPVWSFRLIVGACLLLAIPTAVKVLPGRTGTDAGANSAQESPGQESPEQEALEPETPDQGSGDVSDTDASDIDAISVNSGKRERAFRSRAADRVGEAMVLVAMLSPFLIGMIVFGLIVGFGPGKNIAGAAVFIGTMQLAAVVGRFVAGAVTDRVAPFAVNILGVVLGIVGLVCTVLVDGGLLFAAMMIVGLGLGTMQSASLVMAFDSVSTPGKASVAWNMNFDIGLAIAGILGGLGFTYLGDSATFLLCALLLLVAGALSWAVRARRRHG